MLGACSTSLHGTFIASSDKGDGSGTAATTVGPVEGRSCQTRPLYVLATGEPATTHAAIEAAKAVHENTRFLTDIAIDDETRWSFLYSVQCVVVRAMAWE